MTSKLTIEQAKRLRNDFECWQQDYDPKDDKEQYDMFGRGMAAMDMLIAGMYQEPVGEFYEDGPLNWYQISDDDRVPAHRRIPLYRHAQPAPVVPTFDEWLEVRRYKPLGWVKDAMRESYDACRAAMLQAGNSPVIPEGYVMVPKEPTEEMLQASYREASVYSPKAYRAMLAAAPHDNPALNTLQSVGIADRWIPVSERIPEEGAYISAVSRHGEYVAGEVSEGWLELHDGTLIALGQIRLWMPLPAAPQQEVK